jgi:hypothetical protein
VFKKTYSLRALLGSSPPSQLLVALTKGAWLSYPCKLIIVCPHCHHVYHIHFNYGSAFGRDNCRGSLPLEVHRHPSFLLFSSRGSSMLGTPQGVYGGQECSVSVQVVYPHTGEGAKTCMPHVVRDSEPALQCVLVCPMLCGTASWLSCCVYVLGDRAGTGRPLHYFQTFIPL